MQARETKSIATHEVESAVSAPKRVGILKGGNNFYMFVYRRRAGNRTGCCQPAGPWLRLWRLRPAAALVRSAAFHQLRIRSVFISGLDCVSPDKVAQCLAAGEGNGVAQIGESRQGKSEDQNR